MWPGPVLDLLATGGDRPVFEDGDRVVTAAQMYTLIRRIATGLRRRDLGPGRGVALRLGINAEAFAATIAAFAVGARVCGIPSGLAPGRLEYLLERDDAVLIEDATVAGLLNSPPSPVTAAGRASDVARIIYTSGSTGHPKGCAQTYAAMSAAWAPHPDRWPPAIAELATRLDRYLVFGSLNSQVMLEYGILALTAGGTLVAAHPPAFPDAFVRHRATASVITVGKLHQLVRSQRADPVDLSNLKALMVSGSPLEPGRLREALDVLGPVVFHGYGQTETGMISMASPGERPDTVGRPPSVIDLKFCDGELYVRTPAQAGSYWRDPSESARVFVDGWIRTRDLAALDDDGYLHLLGRARDVIIVQATLVYAGPIERLLATDPAVAEAYVIGRPDDETGEAVHAFVVPATGATPNPAQLRELVEANLGRSHMPRTVTVIDQVPLSPAGKPDKAALASTSPHPRL
ncbi:class I adenylate-forming enzyme family protein [Actinoplanes xinjiangensis]|uniref:Acyl-CoA synthetase (AMP-forming)/AMP-acid ligase II n=1 Tax=Actinoplanes xinjiangensis TaxID=512350 RepID=A0A316F4K9_9ACTN|nr:fatty acid--CoA ligase family protein [Actinoplanes xinjiangensis]PWK40536.1 acyl-CoA synthetase (AMP-forming)/AMP-acid ligase II [Actinoplanes xinjiangensis]GIF42245.1 AMP-dependent synthetase [Actinoplanes xinjiangensis]